MHIYWTMITRAGHLLAVLLAVWLLHLSPAHAQQAGVAPSASTTQGQLPESEIRARYQNCPNGYYSGPRPGKTHYTKDKWVWAVTPEFAKKFCMPDEFVSAELKGVEAIAYQMVQDTDEERCGWMGNAQVCRAAAFHRFEIYYRNGAISKANDVPYFNVAKIPSRMLISQTERERLAIMRSVKSKPRLGAFGVFDSEQFGLQVVHDNLIVWTLGSLYQQLYYEDVFEGIDVVALESGSGFSRREGWINAKSRNMAITVQKQGSSMRSYFQKKFEEFALVVPLPLFLSEQVIANDEKRGMDFKAILEEAEKKSK